MHIHVQGADGEAKFWIEPEIDLVQNYGLSQRSLKKAIQLIKEHKDEIDAVWNKHFPG